MKTALYWILAFVITIGAAYYQRKTGPTYPKRINIDINGEENGLKLIRSIEISSKDEVKLSITDTSIRAKIYYKRFKTNDDYETADFVYKVKPIDSWLMNKIFKITEEKGYFASLPDQPAAGKLQYYFEITDMYGSIKYFENEPIVVRYKGAVPTIYLAPHILLMFIAMLLSTLAGIMAIAKHKSYKINGFLTLIFLLLGGMVLGPVVQYYAFGAAWTGVPFGWDLTDNKTLIASILWIIAVVANRKNNKPTLTIIAALMLLIIYSIPHSMFGSELNYESGEVIQAMISKQTFMI